VGGKKVTQFVEKDAGELDKDEQTAAQNAGYSGNLVEIEEPGEG
jgi:hypothetical protein